jgi:hypothetical protein
MLGLVVAVDSVDSMDPESVHDVPRLFLQFIGLVGWRHNKQHVGVWINLVQGSESSEWRRYYGNFDRIHFGRGISDSNSDG